MKRLKIAPAAQPIAAGTAAKTIDPTAKMIRTPKPVKAANIPAKMNENASIGEFRHGCSISAIA
jgi:murein endopeptidase